MDRPPSNSPLPPLPPSGPGGSPSVVPSRGPGEGSASPALHNHGLGLSGGSAGPGGSQGGRSPYQPQSIPRMSNILNHNSNSQHSTPAPPSQHQNGSPSASFPRLPGLGGGLPPLPSLSSSTSSSHRNPMSVSSMVSPTQSNRPPPPNPLDRSGGPSLDPLPRIPDYVRRPAGAASPDTQSHTVQLPGTTSAKPPGAHSPPRPGAPPLHHGRSASSISATATAGQGQGQGQAGSSQGNAGRGGYPPLPSAFARENPYSPAWPLKARQSDGPSIGAQPPGGGAGSPQSLGHGLPTTQQSTAAGSSSFGSYNRPPSSQPHSQPSHQHSHSTQSQNPPQPPSRQSGSPYAPSHPWGAPSSQSSAQQQQSHGGDFYPRAGYGQPPQHSSRPSAHSQKSDPSAGQKQQAHSPRFGSVATMASQPTAPSGSTSLYGQPPANGHHPEPYAQRQATDSGPRGLPSAVPTLPPAAGANGHPHTNGHKRRRSEQAAPAVRQPPTAPFTLAQQRQAEIRPPLLKVDSAPVLAAVPEPEGGRPHLGRKVYCPFTEPAQLLSGELLRNGVGGVVEVAVPVGCLEGARWRVGDPAEFTGEEAVRIPAEVWELEGLRKSKVWGSDVYTDDSDVVGIAIHSGWLRLSPREDGEEPEPAKVQTLLLRLLVVPALIRYQGCTRQGLRSRSWGNGHEGVSLMVVGVDELEERVRPRQKKRLMSSHHEAYTQAARAYEALQLNSVEA